MPTETGGPVLPHALPVWIALSTLAFLTACSSTSPSDETGGSDASGPIVGRLIATFESEGFLEADGRDRYVVELAKGTALRLEVNQEQVDLEIHVTSVPAASESPETPETVIFDTPTDRDAPEQVCYVAPSSGNYSVEVHPFRGSGRYSLQVVALRPATPKDQECAEAQRRFLQAQASARDNETRAELYHRSALGFDKAGETFLAALAWREAGAAWLNAGAPERATEHFEYALVLARRGRNSYLEINTLNRLGLTQAYLGDLDLAWQNLEIARDLAVVRGDRRALATALTNLGGLAPEIGEPHRALDPLREAARIWTEEGDLGEVAQTLVHRGTALGLLERHEEAADALKEALHLGRLVGSKTRQAKALLALGWNDHLRGNPRDGLEALLQAGKLFAALDQRTGQVAVSDRLGTLYRRLGELDEAEAAYRSALEVLEQYANPTEVAGVSLNLGCLAIEQAQGGGSSAKLDEAARWLGEAARFPGFSADPKAASHLSYCRAQLARSHGDLNQAIAEIQSALDIVDTLRDRARELGHRYLPIWLWQDYSDLAVDLHLASFAATEDQRQLEAALEETDRARAWSLFEQVVARRASEATPSGSQPSPLAELQHQLNLLAETRRRLQPEDVTSIRVKSPRLERVESELRAVARELDDARAEFRAEARGVGRLGSPRLVTTDEVQEFLPGNAALLTYALDEPSSRLFVVTRDRVEVATLPGREQLESRVVSFYRGLQSSEIDDLQWRLMAEELGPLLLPSGSLPEEIRHLIVVSHGLLHYVPFAVLASPRNGHRVGHEGHVLLDDYVISYAPSAAVLLALEQRRQDARPNAKLAVWADPVYEPEDERVGNDVRTEGFLDSRTSASRGPGVEIRILDGPLPRLPHSLVEARAIRDMVDPSLRASWLGFEATKQSVLEQDLSRFEILHFATHAWIDEDVPELSGLALSRYNQAGGPLDGELRLHEIHDLDLDAELTVLSGCQTALGKHVRGDGLLGLTHGFFDAGTARILVTMWAVDDEGASLLMPVFYEHLLEDGLAPAMALRQAQLWLRAQPAWRAPQHWAVFALHGAL